MNEWDPCRKAKSYKLQPHIFLGEYRRSIWVDGNVEIMNPLTHLFSEMKSDLGFFKHPSPSDICIYREACSCIRKQYDDVDLIVETNRENGQQQRNMMDGWKAIAQINRETALVTSGKLDINNAKFLNEDVDVLVKPPPLIDG